MDGRRHSPDPAGRGVVLNDLSAISRFAVADSRVLQASRSMGSQNTSAGVGGWKVLAPIFRAPTAMYLITERFEPAGRFGKPCSRP